MTNSNMGWWLGGEWSKPLARGGSCTASVNHSNDLVLEDVAVPCLGTLEALSPDRLRWLAPNHNSCQFVSGCGRPAIEHPTAMLLVLGLFPQLRHHIQGTTCWQRLLTN